jgi:hypothetical protein
MKQYSVGIVSYGYCLVDAESEEAAIERAKNLWDFDYYEHEFDAKEEGP